MKQQSAWLCLAFSSGVCSAQDGLTLYGVADAGIRHSRGLAANHTASPGSTSALGSSLLTASRWGIRGGESLGGGTRVEFNLESAIALDTGSQGNSARYFDRASWLGLSGDWGQLRAGRQTNLLVDALLPIDPFALQVPAQNPNVGLTALSSHGLGQQFGNSGQATAAYRLDNALKYTRRMGHVTAGVMHGFGEVAGSQSAQSSTGAMLGYASGDLAATVAVQRFNSPEGRKLDAATLGASYRLGRFTLMANAGRHKAGITDTSDTVQRILTLGARWQVNDAVTLSAGHYQIDRKRTGRQSDGFDRSILLAEYKLSRRTRLYAEADFTRWRDGYQGAANPRNAQGASLGVAHMF